MNSKAIDLFSHLLSHNGTTLVQTPLVLSSGSAIQTLDSVSL